MNLSTELQLIGPLVEIESHVQLRGRSGVYLMQCSVCRHVLYSGQAEDLYDRLWTHAFFPPWGAVDIVIGEVLSEKGKGKWEKDLCEDLKAMASQSREEIAATLLFSVAVIEEKSERHRVEISLHKRYPRSFGRGERNVWRGLDKERKFFRNYACRKAHCFSQPVVMFERRGPLPEISRFFGIIIAMFYNDHSPPHFHAKYGDFTAVIAIETGEIVDGRLPPRVLGLVQEWREYHKDELTEDWNLARERKALKEIKPLE